MKVKFTLLSLIISISFTNAQVVEPERTPLDTLTAHVSQIRSELDVLKRLKVTGYIQPQYQSIDSAGAASYAGGNFAPGVQSRFMMRRGRIKFTYTSADGLAQFVMQPDISEKGLFIRETYLRVTDPWTKWTTLTSGVYWYQFGHDIVYTSQLRETPERARVFQTIFPVERDLCTYLTIQAPKTSRLNWIKMDVGVGNGAGVASEFDNNKDFTGRLSINRTNKSETVKYGFGVSYLSGKWRQNRKVYYDLGTNTAGDIGFLSHSDTVNYNRNAKREYLGVDFQLTIDQPLGITTVRAEYIQGVQPGTSSSSTSFTAAPTSDIFIRNFNGASFYFIQDILKSKWQVVAKYDWYDPNTKISGKQIGKTGTNTKAGDIMYTTIGLGINYHFNEHVKITGYYDMVKNENTSLKGFTRDLPDNVLTFRIQYRF